MRITYFRLKGYINILNGMGLDEITLPFHTFKNRIVLVSGENGTGKSTLIGALSPNPDGSDAYRTDVFIDQYGNRQIIEYPAEKEIHYQEIDQNGDINEYAILIQSIVDESRTRRTTKAFISKNGEELNPNGNVQSFKDIRDSILSIDPVYLDLSSVSAENRGIVDMIPSERRKYMAAYIGSLDTYNNIFKIISKKVSNLKSYMNTLNTKIIELGNEGEMRMRLASMEDSLAALNLRRDNLLKELSNAETIVTVIDPDNKMQDLYASISDRLRDINFKIDNSTKRYGELCTILGYDSDFEEKLKLNLDSQESYQCTITEHKNEITGLIAKNESTNSSLDSDRAMLLSLSENIKTNVEKAVSDLQGDIKLYEEYLSENNDQKILGSCTLEELKETKDAISDFSKEVASAEELGTETEFGLAVDLVKDQNLQDEYNKEMIEIQNRINTNTISKESLKKDLETFAENLELIKDFNNTRPENCIIDDCPYIARFMEIKKYTDNLGSEPRILAQIDSIDKSIAEDTKLLQSSSTVLLMVRRLEQALSLINSRKTTLSKIPDLRYIINLSEMKNRLKTYNRWYRSADIILSTLIEKYSIYQCLVESRSHLKDLESDLKVYQNNKLLMDSLAASIKKNEVEYSERESKITTINKDIIFVTNLVDGLKTEEANLREIITEQKNLKEYEENKTQLREEFESVKDKIKLVKEKIDSVNTLKSDLSNIEETISPLQNDINNLKYNLANLVNYQEEYNDSLDKYDKMVFIRNACSPGNGMGIQSEYIKRYMNDIIITCNEMLRYMFNGAIQLDVPVINEKQFSIPFIGPGGIPVPDISNGSTAQKCMIGLVFSCVAMMKSSTKYNIPRFDEVDGGLDQNNRITFIGVLNQILDYMQSEQCVICSHNVEFDTQATTRIICSHGGIKIEQ